jgi:malonyl-CoA/methylmalonyl-CoA synthetase
VAGVLESAVFGVAHPDFGESVLAAVVLDDPTLSTDAIAAEVEPNLARFKHPRQYIITDALPRNTMGKVQKNILREQHGAVVSG